MSIEDYDEDRSDDNSEYLECGGGGGPGNWLNPTPHSRAREWGVGFGVFFEKYRRCLDKHRTVYLKCSQHT